MSKPLVVFGASLLAEQVHYYFTAHAGRRVDAFAVDPEYLTAAQCCGLPVLPLEEAKRRFPPATHDLFVAIGYSQFNQARKRTFLAMRASGYTLPSFVHETAVVARNVRVGANTLIRELASVGPFSALGDDVVIGAHTSVSHHASIASHSYLSTAAIVCGGATIGECSFVGANATVRDGVAVGADCIVGAGALILADCAPGGVYPGAAAQRRPPRT